jgi:hypothetical protein
LLRLLRSLRVVVDLFVDICCLLSYTFVGYCFVCFCYDYSLFGRFVVGLFVVVTIFCYLITDLLLFVVRCYGHCCYVVVYSCLFIYSFVVVVYLLLHLFY